ncbi:MAG: type IV secretory system conjugative DNA transfer family protein [Aggregatilineales bacterium]
MLYWLYTDGRAALSSLLVAFVLLSVGLPVALCVILGRGIQRDASGQRMGGVGLQRLLVLVTFAMINLTVIAGYVTITSGTAVLHRRAIETASATILALTGGPNWIDHGRLFSLSVMALMACAVASAVLHAGVRNGGWLRERIDRLRRPPVNRGAMGSAHFCTLREYRRFRRLDPDGITLYGAFWGMNRLRLELGFGRLCLNGEDAARGLLTIGGPGSGKTQGVILPVIADRMLAGHSLIVADPQGELITHILPFAKATGHLVVVHDPTSTSGARYNLSEGITNVADARAIANVLVPPGQGDNRFWSDSATDLLAACLLIFPNLGEIYSALSDLKKLAQTFRERGGDAALLANSFMASVNADGRVASNVVATLGTALTGWADATTRGSTSTSDFQAELIVSQPAVVVLTCPGRMRAVYASYLGATLRKLMLDLDTIGERNNGPLPMPVGIILDEFPTLGRLDSLVADVNLVRKRRISILIGAQSKGQFHRLYGPDGTQSLFTGLATQIVYGGCDVETAEFYSKASGTATVNAAGQSKSRENDRQRALLTTDEVITPLDGNCTIFARYVEPAFATQVVMTAQLTRLYERADWRQRLAATQGVEPRLAQRGTSLNLLPPPAPVLAETVSRPPPDGAQSSSPPTDAQPFVPRDSAAGQPPKKPRMTFEEFEARLAHIYGTADSLMGLAKAHKQAHLSASGREGVQTLQKERSSNAGS